MINNKIIKFITVGHVDAGKSTTLGHLLYLTKNITDHEFKNIEKEAELNGKKKFSYAYILDSDNDERIRGITQSYNKYDFIYNNQQYQMLDTPGHKMYIKEMISAVSKNNDSIVCVLISTIESEFNAGFINGMTKDDILISRGCDIKHIIILINKIDMIDENIRKIKINEIKEKIHKFVNKLGFESISYICVSGWTGQNLIKQQDDLNDMSLIEKIEEIGNNKQNNNIEEKNKLIEKNKFKISFNAYNIPNIISLGYNCIIHLVDQDNTDIEYELECEIGAINDLKNNNKSHVSNNDKVYLGIKLLNNKLIKCYNNQRIILRYNDTILGFGKIIISN